MGILRTWVMVLLMYMDRATRHNSEPKDDKNTRQSLQSISMQEADSRSESNEDKERAEHRGYQMCHRDSFQQDQLLQWGGGGGNRREAYGSGTIPYYAKAHHHHTWLKSQ